MFTTIHMYFCLSSQTQKTIRYDTDVAITCAHYPLTPRDHNGHTMELNACKAILVPQLSTYNNIGQHSEQEIDSHELCVCSIKQFHNVTR